MLMHFVVVLGLEFKNEKGLSEGHGGLESSIHVCKLWE